MSDKTFWHQPSDCEYTESIVKMRVVRIRKHRDSDGTYANDLAEIHLDDGSVVISKDNVRVLNARLNSEE